MIVRPLDAGTDVKAGPEAPSAPPQVSQSDRSEVPKGVGPAVEQQLVRTREAREEGELTQEKLQEAIERLNAESQLRFTRLNFRIEGDDRRIVVQVYDKNTDELIRQIPAEETLKLAERLKEGVGSLIDTTG